MVRRVALVSLGLGGVFAGAVTLQSARMIRRLPASGRVAVDGVTTIDDAVEACRQTGLRGWDLVAYAQRLAARKFTYSRLNTWERPERAFERGRGYCEQQALALQRIYDRLGVSSRPVFALRCKFPPDMIDGMPWSGGLTGHAWLRVRVGDEERDVCPGSVENTPGVTQFEVLSRVLPLSVWLRPWTHLGSALENIRRDMMARRAFKRTAEGVKVSA